MTTDTALPAVPAVRALLEGRLGADPDRRDLLERFDQWGGDLTRAVEEVYPPETVARVAELIAAAHQARPEALRARDRARLLSPDWIQQPSMLGYAAYAERLGGSLTGVADAIPYLSELGVTYLHLMPLLQPRPEPNDGGYAVADYRSVRSDLGTMADLADLAGQLHRAGISLTLDLVLNHVAREHEWAVRARAGEARYRDYFYAYDDRATPDAFEQTLLEVFPEFAPGNFTWDDDLQGWVWTTFQSWQWDLNWSNPDVFCEFVDIILFLANQGVDCLRLDAIAFLWKRLGTVCQNEPEVHAITEALRAMARIAAPALVFKAEAIVAPDELVAYLGVGERAGKVSDLAYQNSLMVQVWSALAAADARLMSVALSRFPSIPTTTAWATYLRCHDDIGWAIDDADAASIGWSGFEHRAFLADYYSGVFPGSPARGADFQVNPATGDRRTSGTAAGLAGVESAVAHGDDAACDLAIARLLCGYAMVLGYGGIPLLYMGDEIGLGADHGYLDDPARRDDNRWMHRPFMDWDLAAQRHDASTAAGRIWRGMRRLVTARASLASLHAATPTHVESTGDPALVLFVRSHAAGSLVQVYNVSAQRRLLPLGQLRGLLDAPFDVLASSSPPCEGDGLVLEPYGALWLVDRA